MILDGVVDPTEWITYKVIFSAAAETYSHLLYQFLHYSLADTEKTYSGLTGGCAKAGRAGCKLAEFIGGNPTGNDVKAFVNYIHDVSDLPSGLGNQNDLFSALVEPRALSSRI